MEKLLQDVRYSLRTWRRSPGFVLVAVLTLALGTGASSAIWSIVDAVVLRPLPYPQPQQLVQVWTRFTGAGNPAGRDSVSIPEFMDMQRNRSMSAMAAIGNRNLNVSFDGMPERVKGARVSPAFFQVLGVQALVGRTFLPEEWVPGRDQEAVLGNAIWRRHFAADPRVVGRKLMMNGRSYLIVGVMPSGFQEPRYVEIWMPMSFTAEDLAPASRNDRGLEVMARIRPGLSLAQARADKAVVAQRLAAENPQYAYRDFNFAVLLVPLLDQKVGDSRTALWVLLGAVGLVLSIACTNVANLLLVRASTREREVAVRQALGAGRGRLTRQLLTESAVLGLSGGLAGLGLAAVALRSLVAAAAAAGGFPRMDEVRLDGAALAFTLLVSLATGLLFGLAPVLSLQRCAFPVALNGSGRGGSGGTRPQRLRAALVVVEIAMALSLLAGSGLLIRSFLRLQEVDAGFRADGVVTLRVALPEGRYKDGPAQRHFFRDLLAAIDALPGVRASGAAPGLPLTGHGWSGMVTVDSQEVPWKETTPEAELLPVTPGYLETLRVPLLRGRYLDRGDTASSSPVCVVDETLARAYWPHQDPIGRHIRRDGRGSSAPWMTVVGVVRHVHYQTIESPSRVEVYWPLEQTPFGVSTMSIAIGSAGDAAGAASLIQGVRRTVQALDPEQAVFQLRPMQEVVADSMARRRLSTQLLALFALAALLLAAVGIYGVMSFSVGQRSLEIGIRVALGARRGQVVVLVLGQALWLILAGVAVGLAGSLALARLIGGLLFAVKAYDPLTFTAVAALLMLVALAASLAPACRAAAVDPRHLLREP
jgi:putative ABC transport system permease protein